MNEILNTLFMSLAFALGFIAGALAFIGGFFMFKFHRNNES